MKVILLAFSYGLLGLLSGQDGPSKDDIFDFTNYTVNVKLKQEPHFYNTSIRDYKAAVGQPAYLHCFVKNLGDREVSWIRKRDLHNLAVGVHAYSRDPRFAAIHTEGSDDWVLRVANVQLKDTGAYECQVSTEPKMGITFWLTVEVSKAEITTGTEVLVRAGSDINLTCRVANVAEPPSFIYWYRDTNMINYALRGGVSVETDQHLRTSRLLVARATTKDSGNYTCVPSNSDTASVMVHVVNSERPQAMQSGVSSTPASCVPSILLISAVINKNRNQFLSILIQLMIIVKFIYVTLKINLNSIRHCIRDNSTFINMIM
ncbi:Kin of IRRE-like protein 1 [Papilio xuthus]|uniref:Kin of IRRE-like protein 1 n=1 Tax=Papilio xuthus TaxID=66420 RepID=A0A194Q289_PAPXU|nr:Kin of IRRE-like protein 1 [Papilio xuthus]